jgi:hypothetical protein
LSALDSLLEIKWSVARAAIKLATTLRRKAGRRLLNHIYRDDADACQALVEAIALLGGRPSRRVDGIIEGVTSASSLAEKLSAIQQAQHEVVEKARQLLPRVRNDRIYGCLIEIIRRPVMTQADITKLSEAEIRPMTEARY